MYTDTTPRHNKKETTRRESERERETERERERQRERERETGSPVVPFGPFSSLGSLIKTK